MARALGCIEYADGMRRFFVHCNTTGGFFAPLFESGVAALETYERIDVEGLCAMPGENREVEIVQLAQASNWPLDESHAWKFDRYGLATRDSLLLREAEHVDPDEKRLQILTGVMHAAHEIDGGFDGCYDVRICGTKGRYEPEAKFFDFRDGFGKPINFCPDCLAMLMD